MGENGRSLSLYKGNVECVPPRLPLEISYFSLTPCTRFRPLASSPAGHESSPPPDLTPSRPEPVSTAREHAHVLLASSGS